MYNLVDVDHLNIKTFKTVFTVWTIRTIWSNRTFRYLGRNVQMVEKFYILDNCDIINKLGILDDLDLSDSWLTRRGIIGALRERCGGYRG